LVVDGDVSFNGDLNMTGFNRKEVLLAGAGGLDGTGGAQGTATATSTLNADFPATLAFNGTLTDLNDVWHASSDSLTNNPKSLIFEFPYDVIITKYKIWRRALPHAGHNPKTWTLRAYEQDSTTSVEIDSLSNITNWPAPTSTSITNDTAFNEYPVDNTTTAYRKFELKITESSHTGAIAIGQLAFYGYKEGTITVNNIVSSSGVLALGGTIEMNSKIKFPNRPFVVAGRSAGRVYAPNDFVFNVEAHNTGFLNNGKFTAPSGFPGYYSFTFTGLGGSMESAPNTRWYLNNSLIPYGAAHVNASFVSTSAHNRHGLSCHVCVHLEEGDFVTLRVHTGSVYGGQTAHTTVVAMYLFTP